MQIFNLDTTPDVDLTSISVGDSVIYHEVEWTVAEEPVSELSLYREDIDGKILTCTLDLESLR